MIKTHLALIGCGYWGKNHLRTLDQLSDASLDYVCDPQLNPDRFPKSTFKFTPDYSEILKDASIEGVIISTPATTHYKLAKDFLTSGKAVFVEKPLTTKVEEAEELCQIAEQTKLPLMVGEIFRFNPAIQFIREMIKNGELGDIRYIESRRVGLGPVRNDVSVLWDLATHDIYTSNLLVGKTPINISYNGISHNGKLDDICCVNLGYENPNILSTIYVNWEHPRKERLTIVGGTKKAVSFNDVEPSDKIAIFERAVDYSPLTGDFGEFQSSIKSGNIIIPQLKSKQPLEEELKNFIKCIRGEVECMSPGLLGLQTVAVLEAAEESRKNQGVKITLK